MSTTITGPGADALDDRRLRQRPNSELEQWRWEPNLSCSIAVHNADMSISGLTFTGGDVGNTNGGAIYNGDRLHADRLRDQRQFGRPLWRRHQKPFFRAR